MSALTPEGKVKNKVKAILKSHGAWWCMPLGQAFGRGGVPDFLICYHGRFLAVETKAGKGKPTMLQIMEMEKIRMAGGEAMVIRETNLQELEEWLNGVETVYGSVTRDR